MSDPIVAKVAALLAQRVIVGNGETLAEEIVTTVEEEAQFTHAGRAWLDALYRKANGDGE